MRKLLICLVCIVVMANCSDLKQTSHGEFNAVVVFAGDEEWAQIADGFKGIFEKEIITPQKETLYKVYSVPVENFNTFKRRRFIFIAGTLNTTGHMGEFLQQFITPDIRASVSAGNYVYVRENEWADTQIVVFLITPTVEELEKSIEEKADMLFRVIDDSRNRYRELLMFERKEQKDISKKLFDKYHFSVRVQQHYLVAKESEEDKYVWLRCFDPDRMIFIHWIDTTGVESIPFDWALQKRDEIGRKYLDNTLVHKDYITVGLNPFLEYLAVEMRGLWIKRESSIGGPLVNYTFFDEETQRIYMIDLLVFAPEYPREKEPFIRQLEIIARTFTTGRPSYIR